MEWQDAGIVLSARPHGESAAVVTLLTRDHGRHAGLVRGARARRAGTRFEPGTGVDAVWRARLADQLGSLRCEITAMPAAGLLDDPDRLAALAAACGLLDAVLPERLPCPAVYHDADALLTGLAVADDRTDARVDARADAWAPAYVRWEVRLLAELGFGLDLERCAATGGTTNLCWVSPRTGRAVGRDAGAAYADRLLPLPAFLRPAAAAQSQDCAARGDAPTRLADVLAGLRLTGHFLHRWVMAELPSAPRPGAGAAPRLPPARTRLADRLAARQAARHAAGAA